MNREQVKDTQLSRFNRKKETVGACGNNILEIIYW